MDISSYIIILLAALIITTATTIVGFGSKVAFIAILTLFMGIKEAIVIAAFFSLVQYGLRITYFRRYLDKKQVFKMTLYLIPGLILGLYIFQWMDVKFLGFIFSAFLLLFVFYKMLKVNIGIKLNELGLGIAIFFFGLVEATIGAAGPLLAIFLLNYGKRKHEFVVFSAVLLLVSSVIRLIGYANLGFIHVGNVYLILLLLVTALVGTYIGKKLIDKVPVKAFQYIVIIALFVLALKGIASYAG